MLAARCATGGAHASTRFGGRAGADGTSVNDGSVADLVAEMRTHQRTAIRVATLICGAADAEDAVQEAFVKAWNAKDRLRPGEPIRPWLLTIVANEARNRRRAAGRRSTRETYVAWRDRANNDDARGADDLALQRIGVVRLSSAMDALPSKHRDVLACRYLLELDEAETAAVLGCPKGTVKSRTARALDRLRETIGEDRQNGWVGDRERD